MRRAARGGTRTPRSTSTSTASFLGPADFCWCPEGLREKDARLLGDLSGRRVLEVGAGAAQCARWLVGEGVDVVATDVSAGMLEAGARYDAAMGRTTPLVQADARVLPFADASFDVAFTAFGALPFVPDADRVHAEVARVLRPGGRWVFAVTHPVRWAFPDDPGEAGLTATRSYFDRTPYAELGESGAVLYAEYHRTLGDHVAELVGRRVRARPAGRAGVARGPRPDLGRVGARPRRAVCPGPRSS